MVMLYEYWKMPLVNLLLNLFVYKSMILFISCLEQDIGFNFLCSPKRIRLNVLPFFKLLLKFTINLFMDKLGGSLKLPRITKALIMRAFFNHISYFLCKLLRKYIKPEPLIPRSHDLYIYKIISDIFCGFSIALNNLVINQKGNHLMV